MDSLPGRTMMCSGPWEKAATGSINRELLDRDHRSTLPNYRRMPYSRVKNWGFKPQAGTAFAGAKAAGLSGYTLGIKMMYPFVYSALP